MSEEVSYYELSFDNISDINIPIPSFKDLVEAFTTAYKLSVEEVEALYEQMGETASTFWPPTKLLPNPLPSLPSLPELPLKSPLSDLGIPSMESIFAAGAVLKGQIIALLVDMIQKIKKIIGGLIKWPKLPPLGISLEDLLPPNPEKIIAQIKEMIKIPALPFTLEELETMLENGIESAKGAVEGKIKAIGATVTGLWDSITDVDSASSIYSKLQAQMKPLFEFSFPSMPTWTQIKSTTMEAIDIFQHMVTDYIFMLIELAQKWIKKLIKYLKKLDFTNLAKFPKLPTIPTLDELMKMLPPLPFTLDDIKNMIKNQADDAVNAAKATAEAIKTKVGGLIDLAEDEIKAFADNAEALYQYVMQKLQMLPNVLGLLKLKIPGFSTFFPLDIPDPLIPNFDMPDFDFSTMCHNIYTTMYSFIVDVLIKYLKKLPLIKKLMRVLPLIKDLIGQMVSINPTCQSFIQTSIICHKTDDPVNTATST